MTKLDTLEGWRLVLLLLALALAVGLGIWALVWVAWTIRPLLAGSASVGVAAWALHARRRHRLEESWRGDEWIAS